MQSRLKSRKLLGVGETSSGDIHVSKVRLRPATALIVNSKQLIVMTDMRIGD